MSAGRSGARPRMPTTAWRIWAVVTAATGALVSWAVSRSAGDATIVVRTVLGAMFGLAIGMYVVEQVWARWFHHRASPTRPSDPQRR